MRGKDKQTNVVLKRLPERRQRKTERQQSTVIANVVFPHLTKSEVLSGASYLLPDIYEGDKRALGTITAATANAVTDNMLKLRRNNFNKLLLGTIFAGNKLTCVSKHFYFDN